MEMLIYFDEYLKMIYKINEGDFIVKLKYTYYLI